MEIKISLYTNIDADPIERNVEVGTTIESLLREYRSHLPYPVFSAMINNEDVNLETRIERPCRVTFCNIRQDIANRAYQRGICLLFLKAVHDLFEGAQATILHSIDRGLYTTIDYERPITEKDLSLIEKRMWEMVDKNIPIVRTTVDKKMLLEYFQENNLHEKLELMKNSADIQKINVCDLDGYKNYFYGMMVPSTRYLSAFSLESYHSGILIRFPHPSNPNTIAKYSIDDKIFAAIEEERKISQIFGLS